jgi:hypothetical protein
LPHLRKPWSRPRLRVHKGRSQAAFGKHFASPISPCVSVLIVFFLPSVAVHTPPLYASNDLVQSSRAAIIDTGFSPAYFDRHFKLVEAIEKPGDIRVVWKFSLNGYETLVSDAIGYYTGANQQRVYVHSVRNTIGGARDITRTISRRKARVLMRSCLGSYRGEAVTLMRLSPGEKVSLYLTAQSANRVSSYRETQSRANADKEVNRGNPDIDIRERETIQNPTYLGYINLETGKCSKGKALAAP